LSTYVGCLDTVHGVFPILDYFLPSNGLVSGIVDKDSGYSYGVDVKVSNWVSLGFDHAWRRNPMHHLFGYDAKFGIKETFFDTISFTASFDQAFRSSLVAYKVTGLFALEMRMGSFRHPQTSMSVSMIACRQRRDAFPPP
jgi:hypothetical protein